MLALEKMEIYEALKVTIATKPKPSSNPAYTNGSMGEERWPFTNINTVTSASTVLFMIVNLQ